MAQRALVLGSQIEGLRGVGNDTQRMAAMLDARGFAVDLRVGDDATRAGMLAGYDQLIAASAPGDAAVVYYGGHGAHAQVPHEARAWQCIAPTDLRAGSVTDWRGITAWELSIKQAQLTARTRNVTVILDCCHAAQLSRSDGVAGAVPRALPHPVHVGFDHHLAALRATYGAAFDAVDPVSNGDALRVVACGQNEAAFEYPDAKGQYHGAFTDMLVDVLTQVGTAPVSWGAIIGSIRAGVNRRFVRQRPDLEGPAHRGPFSLVEHDDLRQVSVTTAGEHVRLSVGRLTGAAVGDIYGVLPDGVPPGMPTRALTDDDARALARIEIIEVSATTASARWVAGRHPPYPRPANAHAVPIDQRVVRWPVAIAGPRSASAVQHAIDASPTLRTALPGEPATIATIRLADDHATIEDAGGPLFPPARVPSDLATTLGHLASLGVAQGIRELEGEHGVRASELAIELGIVRDGRRRPLPDHGALLGLHDRYYLSIERRGDSPLFVHVLGINARGKVALLTQFARGGVALDRRNPAVTLGQRADGAVVGVGLRWPDGLPRTDLARLTELVVIAMPSSTDLAGLETRELVVHRNAGNSLQRALARLCDGVYRDLGAAGPLDGFSVKRLSILLAPDPPELG
jgi:Caspase domain